MKKKALISLVASALVSLALPSSALATGIPVGAPPSSHYTVQPQPPAGSCHYTFTATKEPLPDPKCTPGATNPNVTQANIYSTICKAGYTATIRPSVTITGKEKKLNAVSYGNTNSLRNQEYDHFLPLEVGGAPNDARNLWVEPQAIGSHALTVNNDKDKIENKLHAAICSGKISLVDAQVAITTNWTTALSKVKG